MTRVFPTTILMMAFLATAACERSTDSHAEEKPRATKTSAPDTSVAETQSAATPHSPDDAADRGTQLAALRSDRAILQVERDRLARQLESHQAQGAKRLAELRAQWSALEREKSDPAVRERFAERTRVEMESALMMDQEYRAHLEETVERLEAMEEKMRALQDAAVTDIAKAQ